MITNQQKQEIIRAFEYHQEEIYLNHMYDTDLRCQDAIE